MLSPGCEDPANGGGEGAPEKGGVDQLSRGSRVEDDEVSGHTFLRRVDKDRDHGNRVGHFPWKLIDFTPTPSPRKISI